MRHVSEFDSLLSEVGRAASEDGFVRRGNRFFASSNGIIRCAWYQKRACLDSDAVEFTVDLELYISALLPAPARVAPVSRLYLFTDPHWRIRLGHLVVGRDEWWRVSGVSPSKDRAVLDQHLGYWKDVIQPVLASFASPENLVELWRQGQSPGLTAKEATTLLERWDSRIA